MPSTGNPVEVTADLGQRCPPSAIGSGRTALSSRPGCVSTAERWAAFSEKWDEELRREPALKYIKFSEAVGLSGPFSRFDAKQRSERLTRFSKIIEDHVQYAICVSVNLKDYEAAFSGKIAHTLDSPYFYLTTSLMASTLHAQRTKANYDKVDFIFDEYNLKSPRVLGKDR